MDRRTNYPGHASHLAPTVRMQPLTPGGVPGLVVASKYELVEEIGRGAMGIVWRAIHRGWRAPVAVKMSTLSDPSLALKYFADEASVEAQLRGPHVVHVLENGFDEGTKTPYIVMELLDGVSLRVHLERQGKITAPDLLQIMMQLDDVVSRMHSAKLVHRDLKPDNIFLTWNAAGRVVVTLLDFGVAKPFEELDRDTLNATAERNVAGTPWYMSPEHITGAKADPRGDLWSLAVIACECLTGKRPFDARRLELLKRLLWSDDRPLPSSLGQVPRGFDDWFAKATSLDVGQRFANVHALVEALHPICARSDGEPSPSPIIAEPAHLERPSTLPPVMHTQQIELSHWRRHRRLWGFAVAGTLTVGISLSALSGLLRWPARQPPTASDAAMASPSTSIAAPPAPTPVPTPVPVEKATAPIEPSTATLALVPSATSAEPPAKAQAEAPAPSKPGPTAHRAGTSTRRATPRRPPRPRPPTEERIGDLLWDTGL